MGRGDGYVYGYVYGNGNGYGYGYRTGTRRLAQADDAPALLQSRLLQGLVRVDGYRMGDLRQQRQVVQGIAVEPGLAEGCPAQAVLGQPPFHPRYLAFPECRYTLYATGKLTRPLLRLGGDEV